MDWVSVGKAIAPMAPTIGSILGGLVPIPLGSTIGQGLGQVVADALGVANDPTAITAAVQADPTAAAQKLSVIEAEAQAKWPAIAQMAQARFQANATEAESINATMRAETAKGQPWWAWRNLYGYSVAAEATATSWVVLYAIVLNPAIYKNVADSLPFFLSWYTLRFGLLGYIHNQATQEKVAAVTGQAPDSLIKSVVKAVKGK